MNLVLVVDIDTKREQNQIRIQHAKRNCNNFRETNPKYSVITDMAALCEATCTLIHSAESEGIKSSLDSLRDCKNHLEQGVSDSSYRGKITFD